MADEFNEFYRAYQKCYVGVRLKGSSQLRPFLIKDCSSQISQAFTGVLVSREFLGKTYTATWKEILEANVLPAPETRYINSKLFTTFYSVAPSRQYRKGWAFDNLSRRPLLSRKVTTIDGRKPDDSYFWNEAIFNVFKESQQPHSSWLSFQQAWEELMDGKRVSCGVARNFALALGSDSLVPLVYYKQICIGFAPTANTVTLAHSYKIYAEFFNKKWLVKAKILKESELSEVQDLNYDDWGPLTTAQATLTTSRAATNYAELFTALDAPQPTIQAADAVRAARDTQRRWQALGIAQPEPQMDFTVPPPDLVRQPDPPVRTLNPQAGTRNRNG